MGSESLHAKAETYRATAARMRRLAARLRFSEARRELLDLADRFDRLAVRAQEMIASVPLADVLQDCAGTEKAA